MLVCVNANPAIDRRLQLERIAAGVVNRARDRFRAQEVTWVGFPGGATGGGVR